MRTLTFSGASDDLFYIEGDIGDGPDEATSVDPAIIKLTSKEGSLLVIGRYSHAKNACWDAGICPVDEDVEIPNWGISFKLGENGYSTALTIEVPDDTKIELMD